MYGRWATYRATLQNYLQRLDWPLLIFLTLFLNVKLYVKVTAVLFALIMRKPLVPKASFPPWWRFYAAMIELAMINLVISFSTLSLPALYAFGLGCTYWLLAMLAAWQVYLFVQQGDREKIYTTITFFFLLNAGIMILSYIGICIEAGVLNPYNYEGAHRKYFISTGDRITGIGLDSSVTAALISAFGVLYFLYRDRRDRALLCFIAVLLATSNTVNMLLLGVLAIALLLYSDRLQKSMVVIFFGLMIIFAAKVSPSNQQYAHNLLGRLVGKNAYVDPVPIPQAAWTQKKKNKTIGQKETRLHGFMGELYT